MECYGKLILAINVFHKLYYTFQANTFQAVIVADQQMTFVFFIYGDIQWAHDLTSIGFNAGDGTRFFVVPGALRRQALNIDEGSNVGVTGLYIYRVDLCSVLGSIDGEQPTLLLVVFTIRNIFWANSGEQTLFEYSQISQNDG